MDIRKPAAGVAMMLALISGPAAAADLLSATYDASDDAIVATIAYEGMTDGHRFSVDWDACDTSVGTPAQVAGRLTDRLSNEPGEKPFQVNARISLAGLACRPAQVTLRLGRVSHKQVFVPAAR